MVEDVFDVAALTDEQLGLDFQSPVSAEDGKLELAKNKHRSPFERFLYGAGDEPTAISKFVLLKRNLKSRRLFRRVLHRRNGTIRMSLRPWYDAVIRESLGLSIEEPQIPEGVLIRSRVHLHSKKLHIVTTKHTEFLAEMIVQSLSGTRFVISSSTEMPKVFSHDLYIVACPQMFDRLPPKQKRIIFQLEQSGVSHWFSPAYLDMISTSFAVLDYSLENIKYLEQKGVHFKKMFHLPIQPITLQRPQEGAGH